MTEQIARLYREWCRSPAKKAHLDPQEYIEQKAKARIAATHERVEETRQSISSIVSNVPVGWFSANVNWMHIQEAGQYLSPIGEDNKHIVTLTIFRKHTNRELVSFECTNAVYSEWVKCCCETMWHTKQKVLEDIHGNKYPVGDLCEVECSIKYV